MNKGRFLFALLAVTVLIRVSAQAEADVNAAVVARVPVVFSEGHETDLRDRGRPVVLIAAALGVPSEVFREAFTHVRPAPGGTEPEPGWVRENKTVLMKALSPFGVTNEKLDEVSNRYRYVRSRGELWPVKAAAANALVENGQVSRFEILSAGSGYTSEPVVTVPGFKGLAATGKLLFGTRMESNGSVSAIVIPPVKTKQAL